jgi:hypothetical protein
MLKRQYEGLNNDITCRMLAAENKVQPYRMYKYEWSLDLNKAGYCVHYWQVQYSHMKNNSISHKAISNIYKWTGLQEGDNDPLWEEEKILTKLKEAQKALKEAQKKHKESNDTNL